MTEVEWTPPSGPAWWMLRGWRPLRALERQRWSRVFHHGGQLHERIGAPATRLHEFTFVNGYLYLARCATPQEVSEGRLAEFRAHVEALEASGRSLWEAEVKPTIERCHAELTRKRRSATSPAGVMAYLSAVADVEPFVMGDLHGQLLAASAFWDWPPVFERITGRPAPEAGALLQALDHETSRLTARVARLARLKQAGEDDFAHALGPFLEVYGDRTGSGYGSVSDLDAPTWSMEPSRVTDLVDKYAQADLDGMARQRAKGSARRRRLHRSIRAQLDEHARDDFDVAYARAVRAVQQMEDHNHYIEQRTYGMFRNAVFLAGEHLVALGVGDTPDDAFHFTIEELVVLTSGDLTVKEATHRRRLRTDELRQLSTLQPPRTLGDAPAPTVAPPVAAEDGIVRGQAASPGTVTARARVVHQTTDLPPVGPGDVLVVANAGPDWTPIFPLLGGLVLDAGSVTQHAAIVAREFAIPAVVATRNATKLIADGQTVRVDGTAGTVVVVT